MDTRILIDSTDRAAWDSARYDLEIGYGMTGRWLLVPWGDSEPPRCAYCEQMENLERASRP